MAFERHVSRLTVHLSGCVKGCLRRLVPRVSGLRHSLTILQVLHTKGIVDKVNLEPGYIAEYVELLTPSPHLLADAFITG
jgi:hypothetical protein